MGALEAWFDSGKAAVGLLGSLFFGVYAAGKLLNGYRGDRADNRRQIFCGLAVSGICNLGIGFAGRLWIIMILWALNGFAQSALWCNIISLVSHWFYPRQHANIAVWLSGGRRTGRLGRMRLVDSLPAVAMGVPPAWPDPALLFRMLAGIFQKPGK